MEKIDAHQHFWHPARGDYGWMPLDDPILTRPYSPKDLSQTLSRCGIDQTILVQAAPSVHETEYLLGIADSTEHVAKVVGWINFEDESEFETLKRLAKHPKFAGVRPMIQDIEDVDWMLRENIQWAFKAIIDLDLSFDCLGFPRHLDQFLALLKRYPDMRAVLDHCLKPQFRHHSQEHFMIWSEGMKKLADQTGAFCKISGLVTEGDRDWSVPMLKPYTDHVISAFGAQRVMWGSDWPVVNLRCSYEDWHLQAQLLTTALSEEERTQIFSQTARHFYKLGT